MTQIPHFAARCCAMLREAGYEAYPVGGCVRDHLLGRQPEDWDVATSALPERVAELFSRTVPTGIRHGTVTVLLEGGSIEVTTFRREQGYADGRRPDAVSFDVGLREDLARRDFTINAMALDVDGSILDPFGGREDLAQKRIRCVGSPTERFREDALRMLRAVRFSAQLGFEIEKDTLAALAECACRIRNVSAERVRVEVEKTLTAPYPERGEPMFALGLLAPWLLKPVHPDLAALGQLPALPAYRWGALCTQLGGTGLLAALRPDKGIIRTCSGAVRLAAAPPDSDFAWRCALAEYGPEIAKVAASVLGRGHALSQVLSADPVYETGRLALTGGDLQAMGLTGPEIGRMQRVLLDYVLAHPGENRAEILRDLARTAREGGLPCAERTVR